MTMELPPELESRIKTLLINRKRRGMRKHRSGGKRGQSKIAITDGQVSKLAMIYVEEGLFWAEGFERWI